MTLVSGSMVFFVIWWIVLFMVLPFGVRTDENPQKGFEPSAPKNPQLMKKFLITTLIAGVVWSIAQVVMLNHWVTFS
jgi:predicted secreted protein